MTGQVEQDGPAVVAVVLHGSAFDLLVDMIEAAEGWCRPLVVNGAATAWEPQEAALLDGLVDHFDASGLGLDEVCAELAARRVAGLASFRDETLVWTAAVAERLGLPFHSPATARLLTDKHEQRRALAAAGLPQPRFARFAGPADAARAAAEVGFPAVAKPLEGSGSRNVFAVEDLPALRTALASVEVDEGAWVLEERMAGAPHPGAAWLADYVSVETLALGDGRYWAVGVTDRLPMFPPLLEGGASTPSLLPPAAREEVCQTAARALAALGVETGMSHTEIKLTPSGPRIIEVNGRLGGLVQQLTRAANGSDLVRLVLEAALGRAEETQAADTCLSYAQVSQMPPGARRVLALADPAVPGAMEGVWRVDVHHTVGAPVDSRIGLAGRVQTVFGTVATAQEYRATYLRLRQWAESGNAYDISDPVGPSVAAAEGVRGRG